MTTVESVQASFQQLTDDGPALVARHQRVAAPLLGTGRRIVERSYAGAYVTAASPGGGAFGRATIGNLSIVGGVARARDRSGRAGSSGGATIAGLIRYVHPGETVRPYAELGGWVASDARFRFIRTYANGAGTASGIGAPDGDIGYYYVRLGAIFVPRDGDELALAGEIGRASLRVSGFAETMSAANPFEATILPRDDRMTMIRVRGQYTLALADRLEATAYGAGVWARPETGSGVFGTVAGVGAVGRFTQDSQWAEYGARLGYRIGRVTVEAFADGDTRQDGAGRRLSAGLALRLGL